MKSALFLLSFAAVSAVCAGSYAKLSANAPTTKEALPFAAPFMLFSTASASAALLGAAAASDARRLR